MEQHELSAGSSYVQSQSTRYIDPMLVHHLRRWHNIEPTLGQCIVFTCVGLISLNRVFSGFYNIYYTGIVNISENTDMSTILVENYCVCSVYRI